MTANSLLSASAPSPVLVGELIARACERRFATALAAVLLTGSMAREEAAWNRNAEGWELLGDLDLLLIFHRHHRLPSSSRIAAAVTEIGAALSRQGLRAPVTLHAGHANSLRHWPPCIFSYELRHRGRVLLGDAELLHLVPEFPAAAIPRQDAWRLLNNRLVELLAACAEADNGDTGVDLPQAVRYPLLKLYLDMATSLLVFAGRFAASYSERLLLLEQLAVAPPADFVAPFPLPPFVSIVRRALAAKLNASAEPVLEPWLLARQRARQLWCWEYERLSRQQRTGLRWRGWFVVLRTLGWRSWRQGPYWLFSALRASPRQQVYAAAAALLFSSVTSEADIHPSPRLPVLRRRPSSWRAWALETAWNYHQFVENTRA